MDMYYGYWLNKKTKSKTSQFLMSLELEFLEVRFPLLFVFFLEGFILFSLVALLYCIFLYINITNLSFHGLIFKTVTTFERNSFSVLLNY